MAEHITFDRIYWEDSPSTSTPINAKNLNVAQEALEKVFDKVNEHSDAMENINKNPGKCDDFVWKRTA